VTDRLFIFRAKINSIASTITVFEPSTGAPFSA
jgi:hypothetical protein